MEAKEKIFTKVDAEKNYDEHDNDSFDGLKQSEYKRGIKKANSISNVIARYRNLGAIGVAYLRSVYGDNAIKIIEKSIIEKVLDRYKDQALPLGVEELFLECGKYYRAEGNYDRAEKLLFKTLTSNNIVMADRAAYELGIVNVKRNLDQGKLDSEAIEEIKEIVKKDENHNIETDKPGKLSDFDIFRSYFGEKIPVSDLNDEIFPYCMKTFKTKTKSSEPSDKIRNSQYDESISAINRLKFLRENFKIKSGCRGNGSFKGAILFEIEDSDLVIVENFWRQNRDGEIVESNNCATYILPKDQAMDLIELSRGEIRALDDSRIVTVNHTPTGYYNNLIKKFNKAQNEAYERIELKYNPKDNMNSSDVPTPTYFEGTVEKPSDVETNTSSVEQEVEELEIPAAPDKVEEKNDEIDIHAILDALTGDPEIESFKESLFAFAESYLYVKRDLDKAIAESERLSAMIAEREEADIAKQLPISSNELVDLKEQKDKAIKRQRVLQDKKEKLEGIIK